MSWRAGETLNHDSFSFIEPPSGSMNKVPARRVCAPAVHRAMNTPVHPGAIVREECLRPLGLSVTEGARRLRTGRQTLSNLVNERASVSIEMAYRLSKAFGSTPGTWLGMQLAFDLARSRHLESTIDVERIAAA